MAAHGKNLIINTYSGGCRSGLVDVNPQFKIREAGELTVSIELVNGAGSTLAHSGEIYHNFVSVGPLTLVHWKARVQAGGVEVHVYAHLNDELVKDTAHCHT